MQWITTCPPEQPELEISLTSVEAGMMFNQESGRLMRALVENGAFGFGVFECDDLLAIYENLKAKEVAFEKESRQEFYDFEARVYDFCCFPIHRCFAPHESDILFSQIVSF